MLFWLSLACLTAATLIAVLYPLGASGDVETPSDNAAAAEIYRQQLLELEAERARGLIGPAEAEAARVEIARRLLAAQSALGEARGAAAIPSGAVKRAALATATLIPLLTIALYVKIGSPGLPDRAAGVMSHGAAAMAAKAAETARLIAQVETQLARNPDDGDGWDVIGPVYLRLGRYREAVTAFGHALRLKGDSARRLAGFAESSVSAADGLVGEPARAAFEKLRQLDPARPEPRFWLAVAKEQDGALAAARDDYAALLASAPPEATWRAPLAERIAALEARIKADGSRGAGVPETARPRALTTDEMAAVERLAPADRQRMIEGMVASLAARLEKDGRDGPGWQRLIQSYVRLGEPQKAREALTRARQSLAGDTSALAALEALAKNLGIGS